MANEAKTRTKLAIPTIEQFQTVLQTITSVGTTALAIPATAASYRKGIIVQNVDAAAIVYIGSSTVTADTTSTGGVQLGPKDSICLTLDGSCSLYAIADTTTTPVVTLEVS